MLDQFTRVYKGLRDEDSCVVYAKACFGSAESPALLARSLARLVDVHVQLRGWSSLVVGGDWFFVVRFHRCWREILITLIEKTKKNKFISKTAITETISYQPNEKTKNGF